MPDNNPTQWTLRDEVALAIYAARINHLRSKEIKFQFQDEPRIAYGFADSFLKHRELQSPYASSGGEELNTVLFPE